MRKDAGLNGDLDRIPQLAWLLFLKAFDGLEQNREVTETKYRPAIEAPYRWRDWAADPNGRTGDVLVKFVNDKLLPYLRGLSAPEHTTHETCCRPCSRRRTTGCSPATCSATSSTRSTRSTSRRPTTSTRWRTSTSRCSVRCATPPATRASSTHPRPVIRFMVQQVDPKPGEVVLDPACGTGGFLVEALEHIAPEGRRRRNSDAN